MSNEQRVGTKPVREARSRGRSVSSWMAGLPAVAGLVFCGLVLLSLIVNAVDPHFGVSRYHRGWSFVSALLVLGSMSGLFWLATRTGAAAATGGWRSRALWAALWIFLLVVQVRVALAVRIPADWDAYAIYESASGLALGTAESVTQYFEINPNNLLLTLLLSGYFTVVLGLGFSDLPTATALLNALLLFASTVITYLSARTLGGRGVAAISLLLASVFLVLSPWATVLYSDTTGVFFVSTVLYLMLRANRSTNIASRCVCWILAGCIAAVGYGVKPTVIICLVAAAVTALCVFATSRRRLTLILGVLVIGGSFFATDQLITSAQQRSSVVGFDVEATPDAMNPGHFLKVGSQSSQGPHGPYYGAYNQADYLSSVAVQGSEEKFAAGLAVYQDRVAELGPTGYPTFLVNKLAWVLGDGSFFTWGEGSMTGDSFLSTRADDQVIQDFYGNTRVNFQWLLSLWQGAWFAVLALAAVPLAIRGSRLVRTEVSAMRIALLGLLIFLMFFEARARFLYLYSPYFIILAAMALQSIFLWWGRRRTVRRSSAG